MAEIPESWSLARILKKLLTPQRCEQLELDGYLVLDENPLPSDMAHEFLREIKHCFTKIDGGKTPNQVEFLTCDGPVKLTKPNIYECDLHQSTIRRQLHLFDDLFEHQLGDLVEVLRDKLACCEDLVDFCDAEGACKSITLKLQMNDGGAFPWHYDNPARPNKRRLTMAFYLTEDWQPQYGGELQLMPFLGECLTVPPRFNTVALFRSDMTLHRVRPIVTPASAAEGITRYCFTVWFDGFATNTDEDQFLKVSHLQESAIPFLRRSPLQRTLSRAVYAAEYRAALMDCFGSDTPAFHISLQEHNAHVRQLLSNEQAKRFVELLQDYREDRRAEEADGPRCL